MKNCFWTPLILFQVNLFKFGHRQVRAKLSQSCPIYMAKLFQAFALCSLGSPDCATNPIYQHSDQPQISVTPTLAKWPKESS